MQPAPEYGQGAVVGPASRLLNAECAANTNTNNNKTATLKLTLQGRVTNVGEMPPLNRISVDMSVAQLDQLATVLRHAADSLDRLSGATKQQPQPQQQEETQPEHVEPEAEQQQAEPEAEPEHVVEESNNPAEPETANDDVEI